VPDGISGGARRKIKDVRTYALDAALSEPFS
jgi:hypothetical protein